MYGRLDNPMTRMSDSHASPGPAARRKPWQLLAGPPLAQGVHATRFTVAIAGVLLLMMMCSLLVGCVIPPSLKVEEDAGTNSPPAITAVIGNDPLPEPGPVTFAQGSTANSTLHVSLLDTDAADKLSVRVFVDYNMPDRLPPRLMCPVVATSNPAIRTATCNMSSLCVTADIGTRRNMTIVVFDRTPSDFGPDPQAMGDTTGLSTYRFYFLQCQPPQQTP